MPSTIDDDAFISQTDRKITIFLSDCARKIVIIIDMKKILLWEADFNTICKFS